MIHFDEYKFKNSILLMKLFLSYNSFPNSSGIFDMPSHTLAKHLSEDEKEDHKKVKFIEDKEIKCSF